MKCNLTLRKKKLKASFEALLRVPIFNPGKQTMKIDIFTEINISYFFLSNFLVSHKIKFIFALIVLFSFTPYFNTMSNYIPKKFVFPCIFYIIPTHVTRLS